MTIALAIIIALAVWGSGIAIWYWAFGSAIGRIQPSWNKYAYRDTEELYYTDKQEKDIKTLKAWSCWAFAWPILIPIGLVVLTGWSIGAGPYFGYKKLYNSSQERSASMSKRRIEAERRAKDEADLKAEQERKAEKELRRQKVAA